MRAADTEAEIFTPEEMRKLLVALEAGNSPAIIFKHYRELIAESQARQWFGIFPGA